MIDISIAHADRIMISFHPDFAEHYGYEEELNSLDLRNEAHALYAINKWIKPNFKQIKSSDYIFQVKEAMRFCITSNKPFYSHWIPGIDNILLKGSQMTLSDWEEHDRNRQNFQLLIWKELFPDDPFHEADLTQYRQRVDRNFVDFPHMPEKWGEPEYKPWDVEVGNPYAPYKP